MCQREVRKSLLSDVNSGIETRVTLIRVSEGSKEESVV